MMSDSVDRRSFIGMLAALVPASSVAAAHIKDEGNDKEQTALTIKGRRYLSLEISETDMQNVEVRRNPKTNTFLVKSDKDLYLSLPSSHRFVTGISVKNIGYRDIYVRAKDMGLIDRSPDFTIFPMCSIDFAPDVDEDPKTGEPVFVSENWWLT